MAKDVFISYARSDSDAANAVRLALEHNGITCWMDVEGIHGGESFGSAIIDAIKSCKVVVFILSERSQQSEWTKKEITCAINARKRVLPVAIERCDVISPFDLYLSDMEHVFAYQNPEKALERLVRDVRKLVGKPSSEITILDEVIKKLQKKSSGSRAMTDVLVGVLVCVLAVIVVLMALGGKLPLPWTSDDGSSSLFGSSTPKAAATVYASDCFEYQRAGYYNTAGELDTRKEYGANTSDSTGSGTSHLNINKAFSILSFIRNEGEDAARVESVELEVLELETDEQPILLADAAINGRTLLVYVANDGWGDANNVNLDVYFFLDYVDSSKERVELTDVASIIQSVSSTSLVPGEVELMQAWALDPERFVAACGDKTNAGRYILDLCIEDAATGALLTTYPMSLAYDGSEFRFILGLGDLPTYEATLFAVLDVDARPTSIRFTGTEATPRVEDTYRIETVIAPTKSCHIRCKDAYSVNGQLQETPEYDLKITVPVFGEGVFGFSNYGEMTSALAADPTMGKARMQEIANRYRYDPISVFEGPRNRTGS